MACHCGVLGVNWTCSGPGENGKVLAVFISSCCGCSVRAVVTRSRRYALWSSKNRDDERKSIGLSIY